jgi:polyisoprenoid-binding protein YceI
VQAPDFFDADRYPELRFESTAVESRGDELVVEGELTIKNVTKPLTLKGSYVGTGVDPYGNDRIGIELAGTVDRTDFGLEWNAPLPGGGFLLPNEVVLKANLAAVKSA